MELTHQLLTSLLSYNKKTGKLTWNSRPDHMFPDGVQSSSQSASAWNARYAGTEAFTYTMKNGYKQGRIGKKCYLAHRVIWFYVNGEWPEHDVDHINGIRGDNRIENLRSVDRSTNMMNAKRPKDNTSGTIGVSWNKSKKKWVASIGFKGKKIKLGSFNDIRDAISVRSDAEVKYGFHKNHGR